MSSHNGRGPSGFLDYPREEEILLTGSGAGFLGCFRICSQNQVGGPASGGTDKCVSLWAFEWVGLFLDHRWEGMKLVYSTALRSKVGPSSLYLPLEVQMGVSPS